MQQAQEKHGYYITDRNMRFLSIRIKSRSETQPIAEEINVHRKNMGTKHESLLQAREERLACSAEINYLDSEVDSEVMDLARHVLAKIKNDRNAPFYRKLFPSAPSEAMRPVASASQEQYVLNILDRLENDPDYQEFADHTRRLRECQTLLKQALERRNVLISAEAQANVEFRIAKDEAQRFYNHTYHRLILIFSDKRNLVESFFSDFYTKSKKKSEEDDGADDTDDTDANES